MIRSERLLAQIMASESLRLEACKNQAGVLTIGYGHTKDVRQGDKISQYCAKEFLLQDLKPIEDAVTELNVARTEGQFDALVSFAFNQGINKLLTSALLKTIREGGSRNQIKREFKKWVCSGGKKDRGLELRREWEGRRFFE